MNQALVQTMFDITARQAAIETDHFYTMNLMTFFGVERGLENVSEYIRENEHHDYIEAFPWWKFPSEGDDSEYHDNGHFTKYTYKVGSGDYIRPYSTACRWLIKH